MENGPTPYATDEVLEGGGSNEYGCGDGDGAY